MLLSCPVPGCVRGSCRPSRAGSHVAVAHAPHLRSARVGTLAIRANISGANSSARASARNVSLQAWNRPAIAATAAAQGPRTLFDKIWADHTVDEQSDGTTLLYVDRHLVHEVTSPQAFEGLRTASRVVRQPGCTLAVSDHNVPTSDRSMFTNVATFIKEAESRTQARPGAPAQRQSSYKYVTQTAASGVIQSPPHPQVMALEENVADFGITYFGLDDSRQGIVHIIGPEQGFTLPGCTTVCGDSHTATHGAFGALAFGIGTSEVEHVLATQTLLQKRAKNMLIRVDGALAPGVTSKDIILHIIGIIGTAGGTGSVIEFAGDAIRQLSMEARMSICNMAIEAGARAGMVAPDDVTFEYLKGRPLAPRGAEWDRAVAYWRSLASDAGARYDRTVVVAGRDIAPTVTWGTSPQDVAPITAAVPDPASAPDPQRRAAMERSLAYMGLAPGQKLTEVKIDKVFIGSCTNARIEDVRAAAAVARGRKVAAGVYAMVVPGSGLVKAQAEAEGLDLVLKAAGFDWREPGCSMCLAMNPDRLEPGERCASTSNRNFEGRQGNGGRTHLCSPAMAAAAAVAGTLADVRALLPRDAAQEAAAGQKAGRDSKEFLPTAPVARPAARRAATAAGSGKTAPSGIPVFDKLRGTAAPLDVQNVDTDMIIPKQFLKTIKRTGLGVSLFYEMRYGPDGSELPSFVLNRPEYRGSSILVAGANFGCGSSREHAPWALNDFGIRVIISTSFADIFFNNCFKNGMLPITLPAAQVAALMADADAALPLEVDLARQRVVRASGEAFPFEIDQFRKHCLLNGLDDIGLTLQKAAAIDAFEVKRAEEFPWLRGIPLAGGAPAAVGR